MNCLVFALPLLAMGLVSCDKAKKVVDAARDKIEGVKDPGLPKPPGGEVSSGLVAQVDTAAEGVRFRRDLPFPTDIEARVTQRVTFHKIRRIATSALGTENMTLDGPFEIVSRFQRSGSQLGMTIEREGRVVDPKEAVEKAKGKATAESNAPESPPLAGARVEFQLGPNGWQLPARKGPADFNLKVLEQNLLPKLPGLLVEHGLAPRKQWFSSSRRWIEGDKLVLEGDSLALLFDDAGSGKLTLTYEVSEALEGHPCGRFAVQGDVTLDGSADLDGSITSGELTIQSGKIWCSLLHPLVLREEYQTVSTLTTGQGNGPKRKLQGAIDNLCARQWTAKGS
ncbi:hypothetical protein OKA05_16310 [Luteolibacter arcticus]|uniref:AsmA-like C-terminal domain-containing protein n=1 Tax=Luteolibacter arcticus TaxID=1581411 RepID=A0ABT3GKU2_9BACT|nr:hypothetical protein [Luteolibacter arcticus]MCW1924132.1 hypothetical protein [Luteolibacter arcticus]